jgi:Cu+-exporting ATPase
VTDILPIGISEQTLLGFAASVEKNSQHPLALAVIRKAQSSEVAVHEAAQFDTYGGKGVMAQVLGETILVGNRSLMQEKRIEIPEEAESQIIAFEQDGKTAVLVAAGSQISGVIAIADTLKETSKEAIQQLKSMGIQVVMITGDNRRTADSVARQIGIIQVIAEVLPQDKAAEVKALQEKGEIVAFVGDGINDAPALAQADVGIAIGSGTDVAIESGDVVLIKDDLLDSVAAIQLSRKVMGRIKGNIFWAFAYNTALIPVGAGVLYPFFGITFRPEFGALAMALSSVTVVSLSLLLKKYVPDAKKGR